MYTNYIIKYDIGLRLMRYNFKLLFVLMKLWWILMLLAQRPAINCMKLYITIKMRALACKFPKIISQIASPKCILCDFRLQHLPVRKRTKSLLPFILLISNFHRFYKLLLRLNFSPKIFFDKVLKGFAITKRS